MKVSIEDVSGQATIAEPDEGIGLDELALASRNHAMPLEAMRYDVTPPGLHYVLVHYDIPMLDAHDWQLTVRGCVSSPITLDLETLRAMPRHTSRVTLECAGNGRALLSPRPVSQPWLTGAVGTADWTGARLADLLEAAGVTSDAVDVVFSGSDHGLERGTEDDYRRSLSLADATSPDVLLAYAMNDHPLPPQHGFPVRLVVPGWYGMTHVKWLRDIEVIDHEYDGYQNAVAYRLKQEADDEGTPVTRIEPRALHRATGFPRLHEPHPGGPSRHTRARGACLVRVGRRHARGGERRRRRDLVGRQGGGGAGPVRVVPLRDVLAGDARGARAAREGARRDRACSAVERPVEPWWVRQQRRRGDPGRGVRRVAVSSPDRART